MLTQYQKWLYEKRGQRSVETPREWIMIGSEYEAVTHKTVPGFQKQTSNLVGGHIMETLLWDASRLWKKAQGLSM